MTAICKYEGTYYVVMPSTGLQLGSAPSKGLTIRDVFRRLVNVFRGHRLNSTYISMGCCSIYSNFDKSGYR